MDAPFDRGEVDRASLDATERLRARLSGRPPAPEPRRRPAVLPWVLAGGLFVFTAGMIANPWFETSVRDRLPFAAKVEEESAEVAALKTRLAQLETRVAPAAQAMPAERLARTEARIETSTDQIAREADRIDRLSNEVAALTAKLEGERERSETATATATAAAMRAQAMLTLVLTRRAIEGGRPFGAIDPLLRQNFEARYPTAVKAVAALGAAPVTPASLARDFDAMRPLIGARPAAEARLNWWNALTSKLSSAVSTPEPTSPVALAQIAMRRGDYLIAAKQLRRLPGPQPVALATWLAAADRLQAGSQALATLENAVLLAPAVPVTEVAVASPAVTPTK